MSTLAHRRTEAVRFCIQRSAKARDGRGRAQAERLCAAALGGQPSIAQDCAAAARRIGEWLAGVRA